MAKLGPAWDEEDRWVIDAEGIVDEYGNGWELLVWIAEPGEPSREAPGAAASRLQQAPRRQPSSSEAIQLTAAAVHAEVALLPWSHTRASAARARRALDWPPSA